MKTLAAILVEQNRPLEIVELNIPPLKSGQVLVQIAYSGLCHSQLNEWKGIKGPDPYLPHTLGHEGSGIVLEIGEGVTKVKPGDPVILSWIKGIGLDATGTTYNDGNRTINSGAISTFLEKAVISENRLIPIPFDLPLKEAALLGCAIPTGAGVILNDMKIQKGDSLAVFGVGGIGSSAILAAQHIGAHPLIAIDIQEEKLQRARKLGATHVINAREEDIQSRILQMTHGKGVDFSLESAGIKHVMEAAFQAIKAPGLCVLAGNLSKGETISIDPFELIKGKRIIGTWGGGVQIDQDTPRLAKLLLQNMQAAKTLISHEVPLTQINELMYALNQGQVARGMVTFE